MFPMPFQVLPNFHEFGAKYVRQDYITQDEHWQVPLIYLLNTTTRLPFEILFVTLIRAMAFPFDLEIQYLHDFEIIAKCSTNCIHPT